MEELVSAAPSIVMATPAGMFSLPDAPFVRVTVSPSANPVIKLPLPFHMWFAANAGVAATGSSASTKHSVSRMDSNLLAPPALLGFALLSAFFPFKEISFIFNSSDLVFVFGCG